MKVCSRKTHAAIHKPAGGVVGVTGTSPAWLFYTNAYLCCFVKRMHAGPAETETRDQAFRIPFSGRATKKIRIV